VQRASSAFRTIVAGLLAFSGASNARLASHSSQTQHHEKLYRDSLMDPGRWTIGPVISGWNPSRGVSLHPRRCAGAHWCLEIPESPGSVHYVTTHFGSLAGKSEIVLHYLVEAEPNVRIVPATDPRGPSIITLYFQRRGDDWSGTDEFEVYRWYATFASQMPISPGRHEIVAPLNANWTAVQTSSAKSNPSAFLAAVSDSDEVGFVLGGGTGYGHGVYATGRARIIIESFEIK
jgi:hypothetical protein